MTTRRKTLNRLSQDSRGSVGILFSLTSVSALVLAGGAMDFGSAYSTRNKIQRAADAGALAGAGLQAASGMSSAAVEQARTTLATNVFKANLNGAVATPVVTVAGSDVSVAAVKAVNTSFLKIMQIDVINVSAISNASVAYTTPSTGGGKVCLLALDPDATNGLKSQGTPHVNLANCWGHTNSTKTAAIDGGGSAVVTGAGFSAVGGVTSSANGVYAPHPTGGASVVNDPFATVGAYALPAVYQPTFTPPTISSVCKASNLSLKKGTFTLEPGRYCGGINLQAGATVSLLPGAYIIDNGIFNVQSGSSISGTNVLFYFSGAAARMTIIGGGTVNLKGRQTGSSYAGFLFIQHPDAWRGLTSNIQGGGTFNMEGMVYMPTQNILITGNGDSNGSSNFFAIIAKSFEFRGNGIFNMKTYNSASNMPDIFPTKAGDPVVANVKIK